jgi:drug/metabolite transporter (DMT)-like permease
MGIGVLIPFISMSLSPYLKSDIFSFMMGSFIIPTPIQWIYLIGIGITASLGQVYMTKAYGTTKAGVIGAAGYSVIIFSLIIGLILGDNLPNIYGTIGIIAIILGGILIARDKN